MSAPLAALQSALDEVLLDEIDRLRKRCKLDLDEATVVATATIRGTSPAEADSILTGRRGGHLVKMARALYEADTAKLEALRAGMRTGKLVPIFGRKKRTKGAS